MENEQSARRVDLYVLRTNDARAFYERLGFRHESRWLVHRLEKGRFADALPSERDQQGSTPVDLSRTRPMIGEPSRPYFVLPDGNS